MQIKGKVEDHKAKQQIKGKIKAPPGIIGKVKQSKKVKG